MKKINSSTRFVLVLFVLILLVSTRSMGQTLNDYYRTVWSGDWSDSSIWEVSPNGFDSWTAAEHSPEAANSIEICAGHSVRLMKDQRIYGSLILSTNEAAEKAELDINGYTLTISGDSVNRAFVFIPDIINDIGSIPGQGCFIGSATSQMIVGPYGEANLRFSQDSTNNYLQSLTAVGPACSASLQNSIYIVGTHN